MSYRVGEVAEILGLSPQGVRFLERKGYLKSGRKENGYRVYERRDLTIAQQVQDYASVGFTLREAADIVMHSDLDRIELQLKRCDEKIEERIEELQERRRALALRRKVVERIRNDRPMELSREEEERLYLPLEGQFSLPDSPEKRRVEREWMRQYPIALLAKMPVLRDGAACDSKGICIATADAERLRLSVPEGTIRIRPGLYWSASICKPVGEMREFLPIFEATRETGLVPDGPMISMVEISVFREGQRSTVSRVLLPVKTDKE